MGGGGYIGDVGYETGVASKAAPLGGKEAGSLGVASDNSNMKKACPLLTFVTPLNSVNPHSLGNITIGDELPICEHDGSIVAIDASGIVVGSITAIELAQLFACMEMGYQYVAEVESINGGTCLVRIRHRR